MFLEKTPFKYKKMSLAMQIKTAIGYRVLVCFLLAICVAILLSVNAFITSTHRLEQRLDERCKQLKGFVISQILIDNSTLKK